MLDPEWTFVLASPAGAQGIDLGDIHDLEIVWQRSRRGPTLTGTLDLHDEAAHTIVRHLQSGVPILSGWRRRNPGEPAHLRFRGLWMPMEETVDGDEATMRIRFGPHARLQHRHLTGRWDNTDAGQIAAALINTTNGLSHTGVRVGTIDPSKNRDRAYDDKNIMEAIEQLTEVIDGFDFELVPVDEGPVVAALRVWASQGADRTGHAVFGLGAGTLANVAGVTRQSHPPVNWVKVIGDQLEDGTIPSSVRQDTDSQAVWGRYEHVEHASDGTTEQATLDAKAQALVRPGLVRVVGFQPDAGAFDPWGQGEGGAWLGDTVTLQVREGALDFTATPRINEVRIRPFGGDEGRERLEIGVDTEELVIQ